ncbi:MAG: lipopolysaccharide biosynthesis protein [Verrucomicrobiales bacterium]|nr:lipopolysaccharide biosynthesis protein [Verrucomicrobiales bacterium]
MTRGQTIKYSVISAGIAKITSVILQFVSLPLAARVLGKEEFGVYSIVSLTIFVFSMLQLGVGPALSRCLAEASAKRRRNLERHYYLNGAFLTISIVAIGATLLATAVSFVPMEVIFGDKFSNYTDVLRSALLLGICLTAIEIVLWHTDGTLEGYLEAYVMHYALSISNVIGGLAIVVGIRHFQSIEFMLIAITVPKIVSRLVCTGLLWKRRPYLIKKWTHLRAATLKTFLKDGISFSVTTNLAYIVEVFTCGLLVGRLLGPSDVAVYNIFATFTTVFTGLILMVVRPFWTAAIDASQKGDLEWLKSATYKLYLYFFSLLGLAGLGLIILGPFAVELLYGSEFQIPRFLFIAHFCFVAMAGLRSLNMYVMMGLGKLGKTVVPIVSGLIPGLLFAAFGLSKMQLPGMFLGLALGIAIYPAWKLSKYILDHFQSIAKNAAPLDTPQTTTP